MSEIPESNADDSPWGPCECDEDEVGTHWKGCHLHPMDLTKGEFVNACEGGASAAIDAYVWLVEDEGMSPADARECAISEAAESGACFAGIGSCCGGGCKHG